MATVGAPLTLIGYEDDVDLRSVSWNQELLENEAREWKLQHGQAVVYSNVAKNKVRLIAVFYGMSVLILPPIDPNDKISLYLRINEFLRRFVHQGPGAALSRDKMEKLVSHIDEEIEMAHKRLERQQLRKEMAVSARKKRSKK